MITAILKQTHKPNILIFNLFYNDMLGIAFITGLILMLNLTAVLLRGWGVLIIGFRGR